MYTNKLNKKASEMLIKEWIYSDDEALSIRAFNKVNASARLCYGTETKFIKFIKRALLKNEDLCVRSKAALISQHIENQALVEALVQALNDNEKVVRRMTLHSLSMLATDPSITSEISLGALTGLLQAVGDQERSIRMDAVNNLSYLNPREVRLGVEKVLAKYKTVDAPESEI
jgi:HEAT repeat protein